MWDALVDAHLDYDDVLRKSGRFIIGQALLPVETATTVRVRDGKASIRWPPRSRRRAWEASRSGRPAS